MKRMKLTSVYKVKGPCTPAARGKWCLMWQSELMPGPSFWYYDTGRQAVAAERRMHQ